MATSLQNLPPNCIQCVIKTRVSPGEFWMCYHPREKPRQQIDLVAMESELSESCAIGASDKWEQQKMLAVLDNFNRWRRCEIKNLFLISGIQYYNVLLIDHGEFLKIEKHKLSTIPENFKHIKPAAMLVILKGLVPCSKVYDPVDHKYKQHISPEWTEESIEFTDNLLKAFKEVYVNVKSREEHCVIGEVYLANKSQIKLLRNELLTKEFAFYNYNLFSKTHKVAKVAPEVAAVQVQEKERYVAPDKLEYVKRWLTETKLSDGVPQNDSSEEQSDGAYCSPSPSVSLTLLKKDGQATQQSNSSPSGSYKSLDFEEPMPLVKEIISPDSSLEKIQTSPQSQYFKTERALKIVPDARSVNEPARTTQRPVNTNVVTVKERNFKSATLKKFLEKMSSSDCESQSDVTTFSSKKSQPRLQENNNSNTELDWNIGVNPYLRKESEFSKVFLRGAGSSLIRPVDSVKDLRIIHGVLEKLQSAKINTLLKIQSYAIPAIQKGCNTVIVSARSTGKTFSYIIPMLSYLNDESLYGELPTGNGPLALVLCSSSKNAQFVYDNCRRLLGIQSKYETSNSKIKICVVYGGSVELRTKVALTNGCDLLITTPHCLNRLLQEKFVTNLERLVYFVLDDADSLLSDVFLKQTKRIMKLCSVESRKRSIQHIVTCEKYSLELVRLYYQHIPDTLLMIGSHLESAVFAELKPLYCIVSKQNKSTVLLDKIKSIVGKLKILIICETREEVKEVADAIKTMDVTPLLAYGEMEMDNINRARRSWWVKSEQVIEPVLICTDNVVHELNITDAQCLVHYSLPRKSKTQFGFRFSTLVDSYRTGLYSEAGKKKSAGLPSVIILIDDQNHIQLPHIMEFVQRLGGKVQPSLLAKCEEIKNALERSKTDEQLCGQLLKFGKCLKNTSCHQRHVFLPELDAPVDLPTSGTVKLLVTCVHDACHYSARILEHKDCAGVVTSSKNLFLTFFINMQKYYNKESNRRFHGTPNVGDLCAVSVKGSDEMEQYYRGKIIEVIQIERPRPGVKAVVKLIDEGSFITRMRDDLLELPDNMKDPRPQTVDVYTCNLMPCDYDHNWSELTKRDVANLLEQTSSVTSKEQYWEGTIVFAMSNSLWLEPLRFCKYLQHVDTTVSEHCIRQKLLKDNLAALNPNHLHWLYQLARSANIALPDYTKELIKPNRGFKQSKPQWAHFFDEKLVRVLFLAAESPSLFFVLSSERETLLKTLEKECTKVGQKLLKSENNMVLNVGTACLVSDTYNNVTTWNRAIVRTMEDEDNIEMFFVDHGDFQKHSLKNILPLPNELITKIPFQAIECSLAGVQTDETSNLDEILNAMYDFSSQGAEELFVQILNKENDSLVTGGRRYIVGVYNKFGVCLNKVLLEQDLVKPGPGVELLDQPVTLPPPVIECDIMAEDPNADSCDYLMNMLKNLDDEELDDCVVGDFYEQMCPDLIKSKSTTPSILASQHQQQEQEKPEERMKLKNNSIRSVLSRLLKKVQGVEDNTGLDPTEVEPKVEVPATGPPQLVSANPDHYTPRAEWSQTNTGIRLVVHVTNVIWYNILCDTQVLVLWGRSGDRKFCLNLKLFGSINHTKTSVDVKGLYVVVKLYKIANSTWSRLVDTKHTLIFRDYNALSGEEIDEEDRSKMLIDRAEEEIASGNVKEGNKCQTQVAFVSSDSDDSGSDDEDEDEANVDK